MIREASREDIPTILSFIKNLAEYEKLSHEVIATEEKLLNTLFCKNPVAHCLIAEKASTSHPTPRVVATGFSLYFFNYSTFLGQPGLYLEDLFIEPEFRGEGFGLALLKAMAKIAKQHDCGRMEWSVLKWNTPAIDFYKSIGAKPMEEWDTYRLSGEELNKFAAIPE